MDVTAPKMNQSVKFDAYLVAALLVAIVLPISALAGAASPEPASGPDPAPIPTAADAAAVTSASRTPVSPYAKVNRQRLQAAAAQGTSMRNAASRATKRPAGQYPK